MHKNFEDIIKSKFSGQSIEPPTDVWNNIEKKLKFAKTVRILKFIITPVIVVGVLISSFLIINNSRINNALKVTQNNVIISENRNVINTNSNNENNVVTVKINSNNINYNNNVEVQNIISIDSINKPEQTNIKTDKNCDTNVISHIDISERKGCLPMTVVLNTDNTIKNIHWELNGKEISNSNEYQLNLDKAGLYYVSLTQRVGEDDYVISDSIAVFEKPIADFNVPKDVELNNEIRLENLCQNADSFEWLIDGIKVCDTKDLDYVFLHSGIHNVCLIAFNDICSDTVIKTVNIAEPVQNIVFPTAFSPSKYGPNGGYYNLKSTQDNNEVFHPFVYDIDVTNYELRIFDNKGHLLFKSNELIQGWDGYIDQKLVPVGVYIYNAKFVLENGETVIKQGNITVVY